MTEAAATVQEHEWVEFKRAVWNGEETTEVDARWCSICGTLDLGTPEDTMVRFFTTKGTRSKEPACADVAARDTHLQSIAASLESIVDTIENGIGLPVAVYQGNEEVIRVAAVVEQG